MSKGSVRPRAWRGGWLPLAPRPEPGTVLPDVVLPDSDGAARRLSELTGGDPLLLHTYRGWFCPEERAYFREVLLPFQEVAETGCMRMVSVSWTFLSDTDRSGRPHWICARSPTRCTTRTFPRS